MLIISDSTGQERWCSAGDEGLADFQPQIQEDAYPMTFSDEKTICTTTASSVSSWYYTVCAPESIYYSTLHSYRLLLAGCILTVLVLGILLIAFFTRYNYDPVKKLMKELGKLPRSGNEFEQIRSTYALLDSENQAIRRQLSNQALQLRSQYLRACLHGRQNSYPFAKTKSYFPELEGRVLRLVAFSIDADTLPISENTPSIRQLQNTYLFSIDNVFQEKIAALGEDVTWTKTEDGELLLYLLMLTPDGVTLWKKTGMDLLEFICDLFLDDFSVPVLCAVSEQTDRVEDLHLLYEEARKILENRSILGSYGVTSAEDLSNRTDLFDTRKSYCQRELISAVQNGDPEKIHALIEKLFTPFGPHTNVPFAAARIAVYDAYSAVMAECGKLLTDETVQLPLMRKIQDMLRSTDTETLRSNFLNLMVFIAHILRSQDESAGSDLVAQIQQFVLKNFSDCNLNIGSVADALNRNPKYLARVFRSQTGVGLLDYINEVRVRNARPILEQQDVPVEEVAEMVGFSTVRTFRRAFAKVYGTTPHRLPKNGADDPSEL